MCFYFFFFYGTGHHPYLHIRTPSFPTRRSSDLGQAMARVRLDAVLPRERGGVGEAAELGGAVLALGTGISAGVEFDDRRPEAHRRLDLARVGLDEQRSEEHTSELPSLMRISYAVFCLKKKRKE